MKNQKFKLVIAVMICFLVFSLIFMCVLDEDNKLYTYELTLDEQARTNDFVVFRYRDEFFIPTIRYNYSELNITELSVPYSVYVTDQHLKDNNDGNGLSETYGRVRQEGVFNVNLNQIEFEKMFKGNPEIITIKSDEFQSMGLETLYFPFKGILHWAAIGGAEEVHISDISDYYVLKFDNVFVILHEFSTIPQEEIGKGDVDLYALVCTFEGECGYGIEEYETGFEEKYLKTDLTTTFAMQPGTLYDFENHRLYVFYKNGNGMFMRAFD